MTRAKWIGVVLACAELLIGASAAQAARCEFSIQSEWNTGFTAAVAIINDTSAPISGWSATLDFSGDATIELLWDGDLSDSNPYTVTNLTYNADIAPGAQVQFGFNGQKTLPGAPAQPPLMGGVCGSGGNAAPTAVSTASVLSGERPLVVTFDGGGSSDPDEDPLTFAWDFGDAATTNPTPTRVFATAGTYTVTLTVSDGVTSSTSAPITITVTDPVIPSAFTLDPQRSSFHFVSTKNTNVIETHTFEQMTGDITGNVATVRLVLDSVETGIDIRNARLREFLFETGTFSEATISVSIEPAQLASLGFGESLLQTITPVVDLHGVRVSVPMKVRVTPLSASAVMVQSVSPILISAADFELEAGIETLRSLASLAVISYAVPTNFTLVFDASGNAGGAQ